MSDSMFGSMSTVSDVVWGHEQQRAASMEGWDIFSTDDRYHAPFEIQALAEPPEGAVDLDSDDPVAWKSVLQRAANGSELHVRALAFLATTSMPELVGITNYMIGGVYRAPIRSEGMFA